jgi:hypothetical protein
VKITEDIIKENKQIRESEQEEKLNSVTARKQSKNTKQQICSII